MRDRPLLELRHLAEKDTLCNFFPIRAAAAMSEPATHLVELVRSDRTNNTENRSHASPNQKIRLNVRVRALPASSGGNADLPLGFMF